MESIVNKWRLVVESECSPYYYKIETNDAWEELCEWVEESEPTLVWMQIEHSMDYGMTKQIYKELLGEELPKKLVGIDGIVAIEKAQKVMEKYPGSVIVMVWSKGKSRRLMVEIWSK